MKGFLRALAAMNWLFPYAVSTSKESASAATAETAASFEPDCSSSPALSTGGTNEAYSASSPSAASDSSSSSSTGHFSFVSPWQRSPSASPLCFGAGNGGKLLWRSPRGAREHVPKMQEEAEATRTAPKGDAVRRCLRKITRRLRKARAAKEPPPPRAAAVDDTARERAEALASAITYCKESLRRGASGPRPASSPSLDCWLQGWQEEVTATHSQPPPPWPRRAGWLLERQAKDTHRKESPRPPSPSQDGLVGPSASTVAHGKESPHPGQDTGVHNKLRGEGATAEESAKSSSSPSDPVHGEFSMSNSFNEIEFLETFNGEEEMIGRHFITIQI